MRKILLTSTGFENLKFRKMFIDNLNQPVQESKVIFVPTAAIDEDAKSMLPKCKNDLLLSGILEDNILTYDLDYLLSFEQAKNYDAIYFCGGSTKHLVSRINDSGFKNILDKLIENGMIYIGVSAGSVAASNKYINGLKYLDNYIDVHCETGNQCGDIVDGRDIFLTDNQAIWIHGNKKEIIM